MIAQTCTHGHNDPVRNLAFTSDSRWLFSGDDGGLLVFSSVPEGRRVAAWRCHETSISAVAVAPEFGLIVTAAVDGRVRAWRLDPGNLDRMELISEQTFDGEVTGLAFRPPGEVALAISAMTGEVALWKPYNAGGPEVIRVLPAQANSVAWTRDGSRLAVGCDDCLVYQFDLANGSASVWGGHGHHVDQLGYSCCGKYLASGSHDRTVRVWESATGKCLTVLPHLLDTVKPDWAEDGRLVTCSYDRRIRVWRPFARELLAEIHEHQYDIDDVAWSPDNSWIASCGWDHTIRLFDGEQYEQVTVIRGARNQIYALTLDSASERFFAGTAAGRLYEVPLAGRAAAPKLLPGLHEGAVTSADLSADGKTLATTGTDSRLILRAADDWRQRAVVLASHGLDLDVVRFSPNNRCLAVGARDNSLTVYRVAQAGVQEVFRIPHERRVKALGWSEANGLLATAADGNVRLFNPETGVQCAQWRAHDRMINALSWSNDGSLLVTACWDRLARVFKADGRLLAELGGHLYNVNCVEFGSSRVVATGGWDGTIGIWDAAAGRLLKMISLEQASPVHALRWVAEGDTLLAALWSGQVLQLRPDGVVLNSWNLAERPELCEAGCRE